MSSSKSRNFAFVLDIDQLASRRLNILDLPQDCLIQIFKKCPKEDRPKVRAVCRSFDEIIRSMSKHLAFILDHQEMGKRCLNIVDIGPDCLTEIFRRCVPAARMTLRTVCRTFDEIFYQSWGHVKIMRGSIVSDQHRGLAEFFFRYILYFFY